MWATEHKRHQQAAELAKASVKKRKGVFKNAEGVYTQICSAQIYNFSFPAKETEIGSYGGVVNVKKAQETLTNQHICPCTKQSQYVTVCYMFWVKDV